LSRSNRDEVRVSGMGIAARFSLAMTLSLSGVMAIAGFFLFGASRDIAKRSVADVLHSASRAMAENEHSTEVDGFQTYKQIGTTGNRVGSGGGQLIRFDIEFTSGRHKGERGHLYQYDKGGTLVVPARFSDQQEKGLLGLMLGVTGAVILVGFIVAYAVATKVSGPLQEIVEDVRKISRGNLNHRTRVRGGGEVALLARAIDRMSGSLAEAQDAEVELSIREREREVALEVREALLPDRPPAIDGWAISDHYISCSEPGGVFHDHVQVGDKVISLVCEVSGTGVPGALVGAVARAYLRTELESGVSLAEAFKAVNLSLARDVKRGMYVTALCIEIDPKENAATVACAGHKLPLIRYSSAEKAVRLIQPEGIALGFDKGAVFDHRLVIERIAVEPGDRLVLANTGPARVIDPDENEFGEKELYRSIMRYGQQPAAKLLRGVCADLEAFADEEPFPADISMIVVAREG